jgi:hypothetical protein
VTIGCRTNAIFQEAVTAGLDVEIDLLARDGQRFGDRKLARIFGGAAGVVRELRRLRNLNAAAEHFELGAYHNALLFSFLVDFVESMHEPYDGRLVFGGGRYLVRAIDGGAFEDAFFADTDFALAKEVVNDPGIGKAMLGLDAGVFGVANELAPHAEELQPWPASRSAVEPIVEVTDEREAELRRRHQAAPAVVAGEISALGALYRGREMFPWWPEWLDPRA